MKKSLRESIMGMPLYLHYTILFVIAVWIRSVLGDYVVSAPGILLFVVLVFVPFSIEQVAYTRFTGNVKAVEFRHAAKVVRGYNVAYLWDAAHFAVFLAAGFRFAGSAELPFSIWEWAGCALFLVGVAIRTLALRELGIHYDSQVSIHPRHQVVISGPYRLMRHPLHLGTTAKILGLGFLVPLWLGLPAASLALGVSLWFGRYEDSVLLKNLPGYKEYYALTWDMVDLVFRKQLSR